MWLFRKEQELAGGGASVRKGRICWRHQVQGLPSLSVSHVLLFSPSVSEYRPTNDREKENLGTSLSYNREGEERKKEENTPARNSSRRTTLIKSGSSGSSIPGNSAR